jgi:REP element-mobilizing transposase RayT
MTRTKARQLTLELRRHGGARRGAGRKPNGSKPGVAHASRGAVGGAIPVLVTMKVLAGIANLRNRRRFERVLHGLRKACDRFQTRIVEFSVQHDHVHLVVESHDARALARAMKGLAVRLARGLNRSLGRRGRVFADRFHHRALATPRQVRNALAYVLCNARKHGVAPHIRGWLDPLSSSGSFDGWIGALGAGARATASPRTWLLRIGWRRGGLLHPDHTPGPLS